MPSARAIFARVLEALARGVGRLDDRPEQRETRHMLRRSRRHMKADQRAHGMADEMDRPAGERGDGLAGRGREAFDRHAAEGERRAARPRQVEPDAAKAAERADERLERIGGRAEARHEHDRRPRAVDLDLMRPTAAPVISVLPELVLEHADAGDFDACDVAGNDIFRRRKADADAGRRARAMTSPGSRVTPAEIVAMMVGMSKMRSRVLASWRNSPLIQHRIWCRQGRSPRA